MDSGNSGSMSSNGDEEYDSVVPASSFLNNPHAHAQIGCFTSHPHSSLLAPPSHHPYVFDVSPTYLQPNSSNLLNLEAAPPRSDQPHNCTVVDPAVSSASANSSLQLRNDQYDNMNNNNNNAGGSGARNPKKRTRASRRAPTTVLTTDTSNFRAMVQEFTGIPAPPFSSSCYSRRLDLLAASSSSFRSSSSSSFYPLRPSPHKLSSNNPSLLSSSSSTLLMLPNHNIMGDANNNSSPNPSSIVNYQLIPPNTDHVGVGVPFNNPQHMQVLPFQTPIPFPNSLPASGFVSPKSDQSQPPSLSNIPSLEDQLGLGMRHHQPHLHLLTSHTHDHAHLSTSELADQPTPHIGIGASTTTPHAHPPSHHPFTSFPPTNSKLINFSASNSSSSTFNINNNNNNTNMDNSSARGEGNHNIF